MSGNTLVITGANGFVGIHLAAIAKAEGHRVWAVGREPVPGRALTQHIDEYFAADLTFAWPVPDEVDAVVHLAGIAAVGPSFDDPQRYLSVHSGMMTTISEALLAQSHRPRLLAVSSGAVYESSDGARPISETSTVVASSPYAVSKIVVEVQASYYARRGLDTVVVRPFNHIGPGQSPGFIVPDLTRSLRALVPGRHLLVGNLAAARDYTDVRDVARAYLTLAFATKHQRDLYNVASGVAHTGFEILTEVAGALGVPVPRVETDPAKTRPNDPLEIVGNASRFREEFSWAPQIDWRSSILDFVGSERDAPADT